MNAPRILLLDVDGTLADCAGSSIAALNDQFGEELLARPCGRLLQVSDMTDCSLPFLEPHQHAWLMGRFQDRSKTISVSQRHGMGRPAHGLRGRLDGLFPSPVERPGS
jgi:phosphoglycolate phosphatase-like HAD superfamily hydrolase